MASIRDVSQRGRESGESGFTLIEVVVAMGVFIIFIAILLGSMVSLSRGAVRTQLIAQSTNGVLVVFTNLDRQVRYADAINPAGIGADGNRYIEFRVPAESSVSGFVTCMQWRFVPSAKRIESRQWNDGTVPANSWSTKLTNVIDDGGEKYPFDRETAVIGVGLSPMQQLKLVINAGNADLNAGTKIETQFVARNSSIKSPNNADDALHNVCNPAGYRS
ncbi:type II secretion system protein [Glaciihabitans sp. UYNi722]|uniref:PulJ/GspJ family protein n=1 Tax=Glaciihabitans sp. UYNi722 TaxID=3156344 RepID=UPI003394A092